MNNLSFRPHHFLCALGFQGKGYSPGFVKNFQAIADRLRENGGDHVNMRVTYKTDSICQACPHQKGDLCGSNQAKIERLDAVHGEVLGLDEGDCITWGEAKDRIAERIDEAVFDKICQGCSWKDLGVCLSALRELTSR